MQMNQTPTKFGLSTFSSVVDNILGFSDCKSMDCIQKKMDNVSYEAGEMDTSDVIRDSIAFHFNTTTGKYRV